MGESYDDFQRCTSRKGYREARLIGNTLTQPDVPSLQDATESGVTLVRSTCHLVGLRT